MKNFILSLYPLTIDDKKKLADLMKLELNFLNLSDMKKKGIFAGIRFFLNLKADRWIIVLKDEGGISFLPYLQIASLLVSSKEKYYIDPDLVLKKISNAHCFFGCIKVTLYTIYNLFYKEIIQLKLLHLKYAYRRRMNIKNMNKALYINANLWYGVQVGGSIGHVAGVIGGLKKLDCDVVYAATSVNPLIQSDVKIHLFSKLPPVGIQPEINHYRFSNHIIKELSRLIKKEKPDFIYQRLSLGNYTGVILAKKHKLPLVIEYNGSEVWCSQNWGNGVLYAKLALLAENICLKSANRIVTVSEVLKKQLISRGLDEQKIFYYPNCVDSDLFNSDRFSIHEIHAVREQHQLPKNAFIFTFIGTFGLWHGVNLLAEAIVTLVNNHKEKLDQHHIRFMLVGDGAQLSAVKHILELGHADKYCVLTGLVSQAEAPKYLAASDVFLAPTMPNPDGTPFFGSPTKLFEYMACGKAIIASELEQVGQILSHSLRIDESISEYTPSASELALLFKPGDIQGLIRAILFLVDNPNWRQLLGQNARKVACDRYTWTRHVEEVLLND